MEEWKDIPGYEGLYQVSNLGRVKSLERTIIKSNGVNKKIRERIMRQGTKENLYKFVGLSNNGSVRHFYVHRLVACAFLKNENNMPCVNHKDENVQNNNLENLEWCTHKYNNNYGTCRSRFAEKQHKKVLCIETGMIFNSQKEAGDYLGCNSLHIGDVCNGRAKTSYGYHWKWADKKDDTRLLHKKIRCLETRDIFNTVIEASNVTDICSSSIYSVLKGKQHTAGGYHWEYVL